MKPRGGKYLDVSTKQGVSKLTAALVQQVSFNPTPTDASLLVPLTEWVAQQVIRTPFAAAVCDAEQTWSYRETWERAMRLAALLQSAGVGPGDRVVLSIERTAHLVPATLGILLSGAAIVPIDPRLPDLRLLEIIAAAKPTRLCSEASLAARMASITAAIDCREVVLVDKIEGPSLSTMVLDKPALDGIAYIIFTSGSTGRPKGVEITHRGTANIVPATADAIGVTSGQRLLAVTTIGFDISIMELLMPLVKGGTVVVADDETLLDPARLAEVIEVQRIDTLMTVPSRWRQLAAQFDLTPLTRPLTGVSGGEVLPKPVARKLLEAGVDLWNVYGPTETTIWSTGKRLSLANLRVTIGRPWPNNSVWILGKLGQPVPPGKIGEVFIGGLGLARGYFEQPELTDEQFAATPSHLPKLFGIDESRLYRTGDLASWTLDGEVDFVGRVDSQIKLRGFRVELGDIESQLCAVPGVRAAAVVATDDEQPRLVAFYAADNDTDRKVLREFLSKRLPHYMLPHDYRCVTALPLNSNGKVDRLRLQAALGGSTHEATHAVDRPRSDAEAMVASVWQRTLGLNTIGRGEDFFAIGGDSLTALASIGELNRLAQTSLGVAELFDCRTIERLAERLAERLTSPESPRCGMIVPLTNPSDNPTLFAIMGVELYQALAELLAGQCNVMAALVPLETEALSELAQGGSSSRFPTVEQLAAKYVALIVEQRSATPIHLMGLSFGGVLAVEIARQLRSQSVDVGLVAVLDAVLPGGRRRRLRPWLLRRAEKMARLWRTKASSGAGNRPKCSAGCEQLQQKLHHSFEVSIAEWVAGRPQFAGDIDLFRATSDPTQRDFRYRDDYGWGDYVRGAIFTHDVPGEHATLLRAPHAAMLADLIVSRLARPNERL